MAYDKAVLFRLKTTINNKEECKTYKIDCCDWGWLVEDSELISFIDFGETEYKAILSPLEAIRRYENQKDKILKRRISDLKYFKEQYDKEKSEFYLNLYTDTKDKFNYYEKFMYDRRLQKITFHKYFWESGLN